MSFMSFEAAQVKGVVLLTFIFVGYKKQSSEWK